MTNKRMIKIEDLQCDECGGYADVVEVEEIHGIRGTRFLCNDCLEEEKQH